MSWSLLATIFSALNGGYNFITALFGKKKDATTTGGIEDANTQAVATENKLGKVSTDIARETQTSIDKGNQDAQEVAADRHDQLAAAHGLRARAAALDATRDRADPATGSGR